MKLVSRRAFCGAAAAACLSGPSFGEEGYPKRVVKIIVPYPPGGPTDLLGRLAAKHLSEAWKQSVIVENRAGASGAIGSELAARSAPDGYTLVLGNNASHGTYELLNPSVSTYATLRDFAPVALIGIAPQVMIVGNHLGIRTAKELVEYAKANPGKMNYGSSAIGSAPHLASELFKLATQTDIQHIPYNGAAPVMQAILAGTVDFYIGAPSTVLPQIEAGKVHAVGAVSAVRIGVMPQVPTLREQGIDVTYDSWFGLLAPAKVPASVLDKINADLNRSLASEAGKKELEAIGFVQKLGSRSDFEGMMRTEIDRTRALIKSARIEVQ